MPQLDTYMYFSQVFWLLIIFITFYILILNNILPKISRVLKLRRKHINIGHGSLLVNEYQGVRSKMSLRLESSLKNTTNLINNARNSSSVWLDTSIQEASQKRLLQLHESYLKSVSELKGQSILINKIINQKSSHTIPKKSRVKKKNY
jgi:uncharacterized membrane protein YhiD involved in acid resistance